MLILILPIYVHVCADVHTLYVYGDMRIDMDNVYTYDTSYRLGSAARENKYLFWWGVDMEKVTSPISSQVHVDLDPSDPIILSASRGMSKATIA
jgi:hypothetical protein